MGGSVETGKIRKMIWETSLHRHYWGKRCRECSHFEWECVEEGKLRKRLCRKWGKVVDPDGWACFYFAFRLSKVELRNKRREWARANLMRWLMWQSEGTRQTFFGTRWFTYRLAVCKNLSCRKEFYYKVYDERDYEERFCSRRCRNEFWRFVEQIRRNSKMMNRSYQVAGMVAKQSPPSNVFSFGVSWGGQPATSPNSMMEIITPTRIAYFNQPKFLAGYHCLFIVDKFGRYVRSAFVALDG